MSLAIFLGILFGQLPPLIFLEDFSNTQKVMTEDHPLFCCCVAAFIVVCYSSNWLIWLISVLMAKMKDDFCLHTQLFVLQVLRVQNRDSPGAPGRIAGRHSAKKQKTKNKKTKKQKTTQKNKKQKKKKSKKAKKKKTVIPRNPAF